MTSSCSGICTPIFLFPIYFFLMFFLFPSTSCHAPSIPPFSSLFCDSPLTPSAFFFLLFFFFLFSLLLFFYFLLPSLPTPSLLPFPSSSPSSPELETYNNWSHA
eukprot:GHVT01010637.1.p1 GENE.GHVT01010637.1~~GHVT01010637.1.p1  ORF type:complete len:104 (+),score=19.17 GHVT01010637.1:1991-2302(+)